MANNDGSDEDEYWQNYRYSAAFRRASFHPPDEVWTLFSEAEDCCEIIDYFKALIKVTNIDPNLKGIKFYEVLKSKLTSWKCQSLWDLLNARLKHKEYQNGSVCKDLNCAIIGAGPIGLRTAIEFLLLGCRRVSIIEKRNEFSRNNVLHLWPFLLTDFKALGAKKFYGKFGAGCIDHINIRTLQCILLKVVLVLGGDVHIGVTFKRMLEPKDTTAGWTIQLDPENLSISKIPFDVVVGADGKKNVLPGFPQIELRGALAIGITCNFVNNNTIEEARVPEISGVSYQFNPTFFNDMQAQYGVKLENIVYYKNETHYFVMTALKSSLLQLGVLREEQSDPRRLLHSSNVDRKKLIDFTLSAVNFATNHQLPKLDFKTLSNGEPDIALFDFTSIKKAANASRIIERKGHKLLLALVGDSLIEPFWPTGSGCGRGVLSSLDVAWMVRQFGLKHPPLSILRERENVFKLLSGTNNDSLQKNYKGFTIDPKTRYSSFDTKRVSNMTSLKGLYDTDDPDHADFTVVSPMPSTEPTPVKKTAAQRRRSSSGSSRKVTSTHLHPHLSSTLSSSKKKRSAEKKEQQSVGSTKAFWEEHNKKNFTEKAKEHVPKKKSNISTNSIEEGVEALSDLDDDVIVDQITDNNNFKRGPVKMSNKSEKKSENKVKYQAKGGGLRARREASKKTPEKPTTTETKQRRRSVGSKKNLRKKTKSESENNQTQKTDPPSKKDDNKNRLVDAKSFFKKWVDDLTAKYKAFLGSTDEPQGVIDICTQNAVLSVLAVPILMDCNRPPPRRTTDIKLKDINKAKEAFLSQSNNRVESKEISVKRAGSVKNTVAKYKMLAKQEEEKDDYYEFLRRTSLKSKLINDNDEVDGGTNQLPESEPREVIDVEKALLSQDEDEERRSRLTKSSWGGSSSHSNIELNLALLEFCDYQTPLNSIYMLQVLYNIHRRILDAPTIDKYYRIYVKGNIFERYVWLLDGSEEFMNKAGWVKCGNYLVLSKSYPVKESISVIEEVLKRKKKAQILYSGSVQNQQRKGDVSVRRAKSSVNTKIDENEVLSTYANIDSPTRLHESDSAFGSGFEDNDEPFPSEHRKLRRVESRERVVGSEQYIVVDFIGNLEIKSTVKKRKSDDESPDSTALSVSPTISVHSAFEEISTSDVPSTDVGSPDNDVHINGFADDLVQADARFDNANAPIEEPTVAETEVKVVEQEPSFEKLLSLDEASLNVSTLPNEIVENNKTETEQKPKYRAAKGLKKVNEERAIAKARSDSSASNSSASSLSSSRKASIRSNRSKSGSSSRKASIRSESGSSSRKASIRSESGSSSRKDSVRKESGSSSRKTSLRSNASDASTKSIVMQNKLLFDKQIAEENKRKFGSMSNIESRPKKLDTSAFERNSLSRNSYNSDQKPLAASTEDFRIPGIVADTRSMFEMNKSRSVTGLSFKKRDPDIIQKDIDSEPKKPVNDGFSADKDISNIANKETLDRNSVKKKKKGIFKKKRKHETSKNENHTEIETNKNTDESAENVDDRKRRGLLSLIRKRSKSTDSDSKSSKQNSIDIDIETESNVTYKSEIDTTVNSLNDSVFNTTESSKDREVSIDSSHTVNVGETSSDIKISPEIENNDVNNSPYHENNDIQVSSDLDKNISVIGKETEKSYEISLQSDNKNENQDLDISTHNLKDEDFEEKMDGNFTELQNDLQAIANRQSSNRSKKKNVFKKKKKHKNDSEEDLTAASSIHVAVNNAGETEVASKYDNELAFDNNHDNASTVVNGEIHTDVSNVIVSSDNDIQMKTDITQPIMSTANSELDDHSLNSNEKSLGLQSGYPEIPAAAKDIDSDLPSKEADLSITKHNNIGNLVFERPEANESDEQATFVLPQISVTDENNINDNVTVRVDSNSSDVDKRLSMEGSDDELVRALDLANKIPKHQDDTTSFASYASGETTSTMSSPKKKKKFPFHIKGSSKKEKKEKNGDINKLSVKSSKKNKRPKSLDLSNTDLSLSSSNLDISEIDSPEKSKKKRIGLFRSKKKKHDGGSPRKLSPEKAKPFPNSTSENTISQHTLMSSDEFTIPENTGPSLDTSSEISLERRKSDGSEYSKRASLIEIERSEELQF